MPTEPPGPTNRRLPLTRDKKAPGLPGQQNDVSFLSDDPLVPLPVIDLEPLPVVEDEPPEDDEEPTIPHKLHVPLGLIVNIRV